MAILRTALVLAAVLASASPGTARAEDQASGSFGGDRFVAGDSATLTESVDGDAFVAGGRSEIDGRVAGDAVAAGGTVGVRGEVAEDLYAAGGDVRIEAIVLGNARIAGGTVYLERSASIAGNATLAGGSVEHRGRIGGNLQAFGGRVRLDGEVGGDVEVASDDIRIGPEARIAGRLTYQGPHPPEVADGAVVTGGIERRHRGWRGVAPDSGIGRVVRGVFRTLWFTGVMLIGALLVALFPRFTREAAATLREDTLASIGLGIALLFAVPIAAAILFITIIGIPLGFAVLLGYGLLLILGYLTAALAVGDLLLARARPADAASTGWRILGLLLALVAIALLRLVPWLGNLAVFVLFFAGLGAFALRSLRGYRGEPAAG
jgi:cytoskeletal protein CcmA (bactofilin family)